MSKAQLRSVKTRWDQQNHSAVTNLKSQTTELHVCCSKPQRFRVVCQAAKTNWYTWAHLMLLIFQMRKPRRWLEDPHWGYPSISIKLGEKPGSPDGHASFLAIQCRRMEKVNRVHITRQSSNPGKTNSVNGLRVSMSSMSSRQLNSLALGERQNTTLCSTLVLAQSIPVFPKCRDHLRTRIPKTSEISSLTVFSLHLPSSLLSLTPPPPRLPSFSSSISSYLFTVPD